MFCKGTTHLTLHILQYYVIVVRIWYYIPTVIYTISCIKYYTYLENNATTAEPEQVD